MDLTTAGIVSSIGIMFGLNFVGLFVAAYIFDRRATHVLWYLAAAMTLIVMGWAYLLSMTVPPTGLWLACVEICVGLSLVFFAYGFAKAFRLKLPKRGLWVAFVAGSAVTIAVSGLAETNLLRLFAVSLWHTAVTLFLAITLFRAPNAGRPHRIIGIFLVGLALATINRPLTAGVIQLNEALTLAEQTRLYGAVVSTVYLASLFGLTAAIFFHVMTDLAAGYREAAITDALTGLLNRRGFLDVATDGVAEPAHLIMIDIDRFKSVNDDHGHDIGDRVLIAVAAIIARAAPPPHLCGRLGGEEFAIIVHRTRTGAARALAQSIRTAIEIELAGMVVPELDVTASLGIAPVKDRDVASALIHADRALYAAKRAGRNTVRLAPVLKETPEHRRKRA